MGVKLEPPQNAFIERYNRTIRYWLLNQYLRILKSFRIVSTVGYGFTIMKDPHRAGISSVTAFLISSGYAITYILKPTTPKSF